ncbi:unnamed protein product [Caenorhabditis auriculariae]|uniref:Uncharacterized protein n=1 Tax=Caenorhabditis auriculariae TaxID=2777116 RepID=A0A8S1GQW0_9PELO|nr:unnamed protein product [Caenorhabditis auriculariae]
MRSWLLLLLAFLPQFAWASDQAVSVKGYVNCRGRRQPGAFVQLYDEDTVPFFDNDDLLGSVVAGQNGFFCVKGFTSEFTKIEPYLYIEHNCGYEGLKEKQHFIKEIPAEYIAEGDKANRSYHMHEIELLTPDAPVQHFQGYKYDLLANLSLSQRIEYCATTYVMYKEVFEKLVYSDGNEHEKVYVLPRDDEDVLEGDQVVDGTVNTDDSNLDGGETGNHQIHNTHVIEIITTNETHTESHSSNSEQERLDQERILQEEEEKERKQQEEERLREEERVRLEKEHLREEEARERIEIERLQREEEVRRQEDERQRQEEDQKRRDDERRREEDRRREEEERREAEERRREDEKRIEEERRDAERREAERREEERKRQEEERQRQLHEENVRLESIKVKEEQVDQQENILDDAWLKAEEAKRVAIEKHREEVRRRHEQHRAELIRREELSRRNRLRRLEEIKRRDEIVRQMNEEPPTDADPCKQYLMRIHRARQLQAQLLSQVYRKVEDPCLRR